MAQQVCCISAVLLDGTAVAADQTADLSAHTTCISLQIPAQSWHSSSTCIRCMTASWPMPVIEQLTESFFHRGIARHSGNTSVMIQAAVVSLALGFCGRVLIAATLAPHPSFKLQLLEACKNLDWEGCAILFWGLQRDYAVGCRCNCAGVCCASPAGAAAGQHTHHPG